MAYSKIEELVHEIAEPIVDENGCYIYDVEYVKEGASKYLRVYIDKENTGVSLNECEAVSRALSDKLDEKDPIKENYVLEVSSPGIERRLKKKEHFLRYIGSTVDVGLYKPINGSKALCGVLSEFAGEGIVIETDDDVLSIPLSDTSFVKIHFDF